MKNTFGYKYKDSYIKNSFVLLLFLYFLYIYYNKFNLIIFKINYY